jgi:hypothetical protein
VEKDDLATMLLRSLLQRWILLVIMFLFVLEMIAQWYVEKNDECEDGFGLMVKQRHRNCHYLKYHLE